MCACMYVCMCVYVCVCVCVKMYVFAYVCMHSCMHVCTYVYMYVRMYVCMYVRMYVCTCVHTYTCMCVCMYVCMYVRMYACIRIRRRTIWPRWTRACEPLWRPTAGSHSRLHRQMRLKFARNPFRYVLYCSEHVRTRVRPLLPCVCVYVFSSYVCMCDLCMCAFLRMHVCV